MDDVEQRFLAAIRANPDDREAREVYADWLEDRGDERGEYLRLEAQLHSIPVRLAVLRVKMDRDWLTQVERHFDVVLVATGPNKIGVIKVVREVSGLGLRDAMDLVEAVRPDEPRVVGRDLEYEAANRIAYRFRDTSAIVEVVPRRSPMPIVKSVTVTLTGLVTDNKMQAITAVREVSGLGLKQAKDLVESVLAGIPAVLVTNVAPHQAVAIEKRFEALGHVVCCFS